jgi:hypothetical protein
MTHCPRCNALLPQPPERFCPSCGADLSVATPAPGAAMAPPPIPTVPPAPGGYRPAGGAGGYGAPPPPGGGGGGTPWDRRDQIGLVTALVETTQMLYTDPTTFFRALRADGGLGGPLVYGLIVAYIGLVANTIYNFVSSAVMGTAWLDQIGDPELAARLAPLLGGGNAIVNFVLGIIFTPVFLFILGGFVHLVLMLLGGAPRGFAATFAVTCFGQAANLLQIIPVCGGLLALVWMVVLMTIGLSEVHGTTKVKAAAATLSPILVCCCCIGAGVAAMISMAASAAGAR